MILDPSFTNDVQKFYLATVAFLDAAGPNLHTFRTSVTITGSDIELTDTNSGRTVLRAHIAVKDGEPFVKLGARHY